MSESTKSKAAKGMLWVLCEKGATQVLQFAFGVILARLLAPSDYGVIGMLAIFLAISSRFWSGTHSKEGSHGS